MKKLFYIVLAFAITCFSSCVDGAKEFKATQVTFCTCEEREKMAEWLTDNIHNANNMSDEEMEDVILQLQRTAAFMFCHTKSVRINGYGQYDPDSFTLDSCEVIYR